MNKKIFENSEYRKNLIEKFPPELSNYLSYQNSSTQRIFELIENGS